MTQSTQPINPKTGMPQEDRLSLKGFIHFAQTSASRLLDIFDIVIEPFFKIRESGRVVRSMLFVVGFVFWFIVAYTAHPPNFGNLQPWFDLNPEDGSGQIGLMFLMLDLFQQILLVLVAIVTPFFKPDVFRHVVVIGLASWIAFEWAAIYLDDIFELKNVEISRRFIWKAAFVGKLEKVHIQEGDVAAANKDSHVIKIGGPGQVVVHLENAALFEKINGEPHIITSEDKERQILLEGFERLRTIKYPGKVGDSFAIFDRRDQFVSPQTVPSRTKDGITVTAKNVSAVYSIHEGKVEVTESPILTGGNGKIVTPQISRRTELDRKALETAIWNLVYNQTNRPWTETAKQNIIGSVRTWIGQHSLDEFLTNLSPQELAEVREHIQGSGGQNPMSAPNSSYLSRAELTNFVQGNPETWMGRGFDVHWVGVGTWETPEAIPEQHKQAFELSVKNRIEGSEIELSRIQRKSRLRELRRLIQSVPIPTYKYIRRLDPRFSSQQYDDQSDLLEIADKLAGLDPYSPPDRMSKQDVFTTSGTFLKSSKVKPEQPSTIKYNLMLAYREKLKNARDWYERNQQTPPEELVAAINHISKFQKPKNGNEQ
ncbi:MAG TPA: hypothetical protein PK530_01330 [Anaerolineales bacterium]|nr:hypothetical protein [Anaerolineales bacterium]